MVEKRTAIFDLKVLIGLVVLIFGVLILLRNLGYDIGIRLWDYWPLLLILIGLRMLLQPRENRQFMAGSILLILGILFLLNNFDILYLRWRNIWPLIVILIGIGIVYNALWKPSRLTGGQDFIKLFTILGGGEYAFDAKDLKGGSITAIMGGGSVDLRNAEMAADEMFIDACTLMGGFEIRVPNHWQVIIHGTPILGGISNETTTGISDTTQTRKSKRLIIKGMTIMGGIDIKN